MSQLLGRMKPDGIGVHHVFKEKWIQFTLYELFIFGTFYLKTSNHT